jgi:uncharacterized protein (UPF0333 family)
MEANRRMALLEKKANATRELILRIAAIHVIIIIKLRYSVSFSSTCTTKILHLTSSCIAANVINLIRPTS